VLRCEATKAVDDGNSIERGRIQTLQRLDAELRVKMPAKDLFNVREQFSDVLVDGDCVLARTNETEKDFGARKQA
jgi:hypothetical protein